MPTINDQHFALLRELGGPQLWSKAVALSRTGRVLLERVSADESVYLVQGIKQLVSPRVSFASDGAWGCDCGSEDDPCVHALLVAIALKNQKVEQGSSASQALYARLEYTLLRRGAAVLIERHLVSASGSELLRGALYLRTAAEQAKRDTSPKLEPTRADVAIDALLGNKHQIERAMLPSLMPLLAQVARVTLDGKEIKVRAQLEAVAALIEDTTGGILIRYQTPPGCEEILDNGMLIVEGELAAFETLELPPSLVNYISPRGVLVPESQLERVVSTVLPALYEQLEVQIQSSRVPRYRELEPRIVIELAKNSGEVLTVIPRMVYGSPVIAEVQEGRLISRSKRERPLRVIESEQALAKKLRQELNLTIAQPRNFEGKEAVLLRARLKDWELVGEGGLAFEIKGVLRPTLTQEQGKVLLYFESPLARTGSESAGQRLDAAAVYAAWRSEQAYLPLLAGGYAEVPTDWLQRYGARLEQLLALRDARGNSPMYVLPEIASVAEELCQQQSARPDFVEQLRARLTANPVEESLPDDLQARLRSYQREGALWLRRLTALGMGALLADDMGLGKTLQAICAMEGRTLIVAPTSVLASWQQQLQRFRPRLRVSLYHGGDRVLDDQCEVTLTSYALLRLDQEQLLTHHWDTIVIDEGQYIKNPASQVAQAAQRLRAARRIILSGTPVENRLEDLWSQFEFLNPGLLGSYKQFQEQWARPIAHGDDTKRAALRRKITPFILRRLKREVAPELPPRTEVVLYAELGPVERELYQALLASTRKELLALLENKQNLFGALELLLRLRQLCCHPALLDVSAQGSSAKFELLLQSLETAKSEGHRALVFSQWTSLLDLLQPQLEQRGLRYLRLDGASRDREALVREFQTNVEVDLMILSLKAGGVGITLTAADQVYILDPWWNPSVEDQAADRAHRIGQVNPVLIQRIVARDTIEERILELQKSKQGLASALLEGSAQSAGLTKDDWLRLLS
jgi:superfamily II DNA or RNA helicase